MSGDLCAAAPLPAEIAARAVSDVEHAVRGLGKRVVTFLGFGELGYEHPGEFRAAVRGELSRHDPAHVIVNTGTLITRGFHAGVAEVYPIAQQLGFTTSGIHPSVALNEPARHQLPAGVDHVYFVRDDTWGGYLPDRRRSPTLETLLRVTHEVAVIGGGKHTAEEMLEFLRCGTPVRFYPADMHHRMAIQWYAARGEPVPDFRGDAYACWMRARRS